MSNTSTVSLVVGPTATANDKMAECHASQSYKASVFRKGRLWPCRSQLRIATWNIEGLTEAKLIELTWHMNSMGIDILCIQETHKSESTYEITDDGFLLILSGTAGGEDIETAGVGFLIAPHMRNSVVSFRQESSRLARAKIRVKGGKVSICSVYAPHSGKSLSMRQSFFTALGDFLRKSSRHGALMVLGDFNARLHRRYHNEDHILGPYVFGSPNAEYNCASNRSLLMELCENIGLTIGNTLFDEPAENQITCYNVGKRPSDEPLPTHFGHNNLSWCHAIGRSACARSSVTVGAPLLLIISWYMQR